MADAVHLTWERTLPTRSKRAAWAVFSDTDRFNRAAGLGFSFRREVDDDGRVLQVGSVKRLGLHIEWVDEPFEFVAPDWFRSVRTFRTGPLKRLTTTVRLHHSTEAVHLQYDIELLPAHWAARPLVLLDAKTSIAPLIGKIIDQAASQLGGDPLPYAVPPPLDAQAEALVRSLSDLTSGDRLAQTLRTGDLRTQDRLRPLELARKWATDEEVVVRDMLTAVERGVLVMQFALLCPRCQGTDNRRQSFELHRAEMHCPSCQIRYDGTFPDSVEVSFRPAPDVREFEVPLDCVNSPAHARHVLARTHIDPGEEGTWRETLEPGAYRLDAPGLASGASIEVRRGIRAHAAAIDLTPSGFVPSILRIGPGETVIAIRNRSDRGAHVQLEGRAHDPGALTAGRLLELPGASELLPDGALPHALNLRAQRLGLLALDGRDAPKVVVRASRRLTAGPETTGNETFALHTESSAPVAWVTDEGCWVGAYPSAAAALEAARSLLPVASLAMAVDVGLVTLVEERDRTAPHGATVDRVLATVRRLGVGRMGVNVDALQSVDMGAAIAQSPLPLKQIEGATVAWLQIPMPPANTSVPPPSVVGARYALGAELARGGMGVVHEAVDQQTGDEVVVKTLRPELAADPGHTQRFFWEARIASRFDHPHAVHVHDYGADGPHSWLVMERLFGEELYHRLGRIRPLDPKLAVDVSVGVLDALTLAHDNGVIHRDVKPANVFLCNQPSKDHPKLLDFGIAQAADDDMQDDPNLVLGTPRYLSPDQLLQDSLDGRSDVYSVGLVLYEMLTGDIPFQADDARTLAFQRLRVEPRPLPASVPPDLAAIVMKALAVERDERWQSAAEMADALRAVHVAPNPDAIKVSAPA